MTLQEAIEKLTSFHRRCSTQKYLSHYTIEQQLNELLRNDSFLTNTSIENAELFNEFQTLKTALVDKLKVLKSSNQEMIKKLNFEQICKELINANDMENFNGLINIGEYFGTGPKNQDVCAALDNIYYFFRTNPGERKAANKPCLDLLCKILNVPQLSLPEYNFQMFPDHKEKVKAILKADAINSLMPWLVSADQEERDFALRCAASVDTCQHCLLFLLRRTSPESEYSTINLLAAGLPSGQIALHRAIISEKTMIVSILLDERLNPSNDLLKQLLICDKDGLTPIDLIAKGIEKKDIIDCSRMLDRIKEALNKYKNNPRFGLSQQDIQSINNTLTRIEMKIDATPKVLVYEGFGHTVSMSL